MIVPRKKSCELFGFDFMIDDKLKSWAIEVNSSPAMDYSSKVTERLVREVMEDVAKVVVDGGKGGRGGKFVCVLGGRG